MDVTWNDNNTISIVPPRTFKKLTGTRFASVLGLNHWSTPFQVWCQCTRTYEPPFEDTKYTVAGKAIEPKQIAYMREAYGMDDLLDPTDVFGADPFKTTYGNFFDHPVLGGMWDAITKDADGHVTSVLEFKTTKRAEDWADDVPEYYALQAALYAWLLGCDDVIMVATFLEDSDYDNPDSFVVSADNTMTYEFAISERYPHFERDYIRPALEWWDECVITGDSPVYDERADAEYLKALRNASLSPTTDIDALMSEYGRIYSELEAADEVLKSKRERLEEIKGVLKDYATAHIGDDKTATFSHGHVSCVLRKQARDSVDKEAMAADGVLEKYVKKSESMVFSVKVEKE